MSAIFYALCLDVAIAVTLAGLGIRLDWFTGAGIGFGVATIAIWMAKVQR